MVDEAATELLGHRSYELARPFLDRDIEVGARPSENQVPNRAANQERARAKVKCYPAQPLKQLAVG